MHYVARRRRQQHLAAGHSLRGRKIGFTNRAMWPVYGVFEPIWGAMYSDSVHSLPDARGRFKLHGLFEPRIEPEIVLHLASAPVPGEGPAALADDPFTALKTFTITLACEGDDREQGAGRNVLDGPLHALAHLLTTLATRPADEQLQAGEIISTGTLTAALPILPGQTWRTRLDGIALPGLDLNFF